MSAALEIPDLSRDLAEVEAILLDALKDQSQWATTIASHTATAGGKRLRPVICLLGGAFGPPERRQDVVRTAAGLELIHLASLVHDDVVDQAATRRGRATVSARWGNAVAVLAGDFLFSTSFELLLANGDAALLRLVARMVRELTAGAIDEAQAAGTFTAGLEPYYDRIYRKTAVFLETACQAGAMAGGAAPAVQTALAAYGRRVGMAFQIADDLLDFTGDPAVTGKPSGGDLRSGIPTLPMILGRRHPGVRPLLERAFGQPDADVTAVTEALRQCGALAETRRLARQMAEQGKRHLLPLRGQGPVETFAALADLAVERDR
ncbi:MAG TPA: polyprenyl synthetase family protein [Symbiobacteriaceae bacterium]|jgi:geranylgeranyl pyrophosphate synthase